MRPLLQDNQRGRVIANIITACCVVLFAIILYRISDVYAFVVRTTRVLFPLTMGFVIAFMLEPPLRTLERALSWVFSRLIKKPKPRRILCRAIAALVVYAVLLGLILGFLLTMLPQLIESFRRLIQFITDYLYAHGTDITRALQNFNLGGPDNNLLNTLYSYWNDVSSRGLNYAGTALQGLYTVSAAFTGMLTESIIGLVISIFMLFGKERFAAQAKKLGCALMPVPRVEQLTYWFHRTHRIFSGFIAGKVIDSLVLGTLCYIMMLILHLDYALLISVIVGVTNIVPIFGAILGGVIGTAILLIVDPLGAAVKFAIMIIILQQIEGNVIGPRILGESVGISTFWIILSIVVGGGFFGLGGVLLGIPVFALIYAFVQMLVEERLKKKRLPHETSAYYIPGGLPAPLEAEKPPAAPTEDNSEDIKHE